MALAYVLSFLLLAHISQLKNVRIMNFTHIHAGTDLANQVGVTHYYHFFYEGCLTNFEIGEDGAEATLLYPEVQYTRMDEYMKIYL
jgi:hypothetical protein